MPVKRGDVSKFPCKPLFFCYVLSKCDVFEIACMPVELFVVGSPCQAKPKMFMISSLFMSAFGFPSRSLGFPVVSSYCSQVEDIYKVVTYAFYPSLLPHSGHLPKSIPQLKQYHLLHFAQ